jgi:hypothetical protein
MGKSREGTNAEGHFSRDSASTASAWPSSTCLHRATVSAMHLPQLQTQQQPQPICACDVACGLISAAVLHLPFWNLELYTRHLTGLPCIVPALDARVKHRRHAHLECSCALHPLAPAMLKITLSVVLEIDRDRRSPKPGLLLTGLGDGQLPPIIAPFALNRVFLSGRAGRDNLENLASRDRGKRPTPWRCASSSPRRRDRFSARLAVPRSLV